MLVKDTIKLSTVQQKAGYRLDILQRTKLGGVASENKIQEIFDKELTTLSKKSAQIVEYNGRKTIKREDIIVANS